MRAGIAIIVLVSVSPGCAALAPFDESRLDGAGDGGPGGPDAAGAGQDAGTRDAGGDPGRDAGQDAGRDAGDADAGDLDAATTDPDGGADAGCAANPEVCGDGVDNNCNGQTDEGCCTPVAETCNGVDDDCDGQTDEDFGLCTDCCDSPGDNDGCSDDDVTCFGAVGSACVEVGGSLTEQCSNGLDDDCDGTTDEAPLNCTIALDTFTCRDDAEADEVTFVAESCGGHWSFAIETASCGLLEGTFDQSCEAAWSFVTACQILSADVTHIPCDGSKPCQLFVTPCQ